MGLLQACGAMSAYGGDLLNIASGTYNTCGYANVGSDRTNQRVNNNPYAKYGVRDATSEENVIAIIQAVNGVALLVFRIVGFRSGKIACISISLLRSCCVHGAYQENLRRSKKNLRLVSVMSDADITAECLLVISLIVSFCSELNIIEHKADLKQYREQGPFNIVTTWRDVVISSIPFDPDTASKLVAWNQTASHLAAITGLARHSLSSSVVYPVAKEAYAWMTDDTLTLDEVEQLVKKSAALEKLCEKHPIWKNYRCSISLEELPDDPVGDPNGVGIYDRDDIEQALIYQQKSPLTRKFLTADMLVEKPVLKALIGKIKPYLTTNFAAIKATPSLLHEYLHNYRIVLLQQAADEEAARHMRSAQSKL